MTRIRRIPTDPLFKRPVYIRRISVIREPRFLNYSFKIKKTMSTSKKNLWGTILKIIIAVATSIAGAIGLSSCMG